MTDSELEAKRLSYPRVSDILGKQNRAEFEAIPLEVLANAAERGTKVHAYCNTFAKGLWLPEIEEECRPYFNAFEHWYEQSVDSLLFIGTRLYDDDRMFSGEFDMIVQLKDSKEIALIDLKTSTQVSKTWPLQLAAYKHLCQINGYEIQKVLNIHLKKTKPAVFNEQKVLVSPPVVKPVPIEHQDLNPAWEIFTSALNCYDYFERKKEKKDVQI